MANAILWTTPTAIATILSTELNSLGNGVSAFSGIIDNRQGHQYADFQLAVTFGTAPGVRAEVALMLAETIDNTNYATAVETENPCLLGQFPVRAVTTAQLLILRMVPLPDAQFKLWVRGTNQTMAATGNTLKVIYYDEEVQ
jgi:hypothetical protein